MRKRVRHRSTCRNECRRLFAESLEQRHLLAANLLGWEPPEMAAISAAFGSAPDLHGYAAPQVDMAIEPNAWNLSDRTSLVAVRNAEFPSITWADEALLGELADDMDRNKVANDGQSSWPPDSLLKPSFVEMRLSDVPVAFNGKPSEAHTPIADSTFLSPILLAAGAVDNALIVNDSRLFLDVMISKFDNPVVMDQSNESSRSSDLPLNPIVQPLMGLNQDNVVFGFGSVNSVIASSPENRGSLRERSQGDAVDNVFWDESSFSPVAFLASTADSAEVVSFGPRATNRATDEASHLQNVREVDFGDVVFTSLTANDADIFADDVDGFRALVVAASNSRIQPDDISNFVLPPSEVLRDERISGSGPLISDARIVLSGDGISDSQQFADELPAPHHSPENWAAAAALFGVSDVAASYALSSFAQATAGIAAIRSIGHLAASAHDGTLVWYTDEAASSTDLAIVLHEGKEAPAANGNVAGLQSALAKLSTPSTLKHRYAAVSCENAQAAQHLLDVYVGDPLARLNAFSSLDLFEEFANAQDTSIATDNSWLEAVACETSRLLPTITTSACIASLVIACQTFRKRKQFARDAIFGTPQLLEDTIVAVQIAY